MSSQFYSDGYRDAYKGEPCSPPDSFTRGDGQSTDIFAQEYCRGYAVAVRDFDDSFPDFPAGTNDANFDCHYA